MESLNRPTVAANGAARIQPAAKSLALQTQKTEKSKIAETKQNKMKEIQKKIE